MLGTNLFLDFIILKFSVAFLVTYDNNDKTKGIIIFNILDILIIY